MDMFSCASYVCDPLDDIASTTTHGCKLVRTVAEGSPCDHPDLCILGGTCADDMRCSNGEHVTCPSAEAARGTVTVCEAGFCVDVPVNMSESFYDGGDDDDDSSGSWFIWILFPGIFGFIELLVIILFVSILFAIIIRFVYSILYPENGEWVNVSASQLGSEEDGVLGSLVDE